MVIFLSFFKRIIVIAGFCVISVVYVGTPVRLIWFGKMLQIYWWLIVVRPAKLLLTQYIEAELSLIWVNGEFHFGEKIGEELMIKSSQTNEHRVRIYSAMWWISQKIS